MELLEFLIASVYTLSLFLIFLFSLGQLHLTGRYLRARRDQTPERLRQKSILDPNDVPRLTVQLPIYNERYVAQRLIRAAAQLRYPADRLEIQVLDDSTDETTSIIRTEVGEWVARGIDISHIRRRDRVGFKAGALQNGLKISKGDLLAIFPPTKFL